MMGAKKPGYISTRLGQIARHARQMPELAFTSLNHHLDEDLLHTSFRNLNRRASPGVDGRTYAEYAEGLEENLRDLLCRAKSGTYRAPPVRRAYIPKGSGPETRPIGVPTLEDRILQGAVRMILEAVYEEDFMDFSYGFRPGRSAHMALEDAWQRITRMRGCWLLDVDISKFFDTLDHSHLRRQLDIRVRDGVLRRLIHKWLHAGVQEDGNIVFPDTGTPQGGAISPLLANIYLHEVLDKWFEHTIKPGLRGQSFLVRYADDFVMGFSTEAEAQAVLTALTERFREHGLTLHPTKTRLVDFRRLPRSHRKDGSGPQVPWTFNFLSFTHFWGKSRKGNLTVKRKTSRARFARAAREVNEWCREHRHLRVKEQRRRLHLKLAGHYQYFGITGNSPAMWHLLRVVECTWRKWLNRRSQTRRMPWRRFKRLLTAHPLPKPKVHHSVFRPQQLLLPFVYP